MGMRHPDPEDFWPEGSKPLFTVDDIGSTAPSSRPDTRMSKMREALLYVGSAHDSVKRDALAEIEQWESELEVMAGALEAKIRPDTPDCPRCGSPGASFSTHPCNPPDTAAQEHADTLRKLVRSFGRPQHDAALDALLADVERLTAERDAALHRAEGWVQHDTEAYAAQSMRALKRAEAAERERDDALRQRDNDRDVLSEMYAKAERERDEARENLQKQTVSMFGALNREVLAREAAEALAEQRCIAHAAVTVMHGDCPICDLEAAEALAERLAADLEAARELERALRWYADRRNYVPAAPPSVPPPEYLMNVDAWDDNGPGARARAALARLSAGKETGDE